MFIDLRNIYYMRIDLVAYMSKKLTRFVTPRTVVMEYLRMTGIKMSFYLINLKTYVSWNIMVVTFLFIVTKICSTCDTKP
jgi:hypothetical protein